MNIDPARAFCFLMKGDNTTYEVDLGEKKGKKEKRKSNLNLIKSLDMSYLIW